MMERGTWDFVYKVIIVDGIPHFAEGRFWGKSEIEFFVFSWYNEIRKIQLWQKKSD